MKTCKAYTHNTSTTKITFGIWMRLTSKLINSLMQGFGEVWITEVYNSIPKSKEWLIINCIANGAGEFMSSFYIFKGDHVICNNYIRLCKP